MYKVFYNNSAICIAEKPINIDTGFRSVRMANKMETIRFIDEYLKQGNHCDYWLSGYSVKDLFEDVKTCFQFVEAAGGLVKNDEQAFLFIKRFTIWDLPKGKMKKGESPKDAARREVSEETGVTKLSIVDELPSTYHIYPHKGTFVLKKTHWFSMFTSGPSQLKPQQEEGITDVEWLDRNKSKAAIQSSYRSLHENFIPFFQD